MNVELQASLLNMPLDKVVLGGVDDVAKFLEDAGYQGLRYVPVISPRGRYRFNGLAEAGLLMSFQQCVDDTSGLRPYRFRPAVPDKRAGTGRIVALQNKLVGNKCVEGRLPTLVYPNEQNVNGAPSTQYINYRRLQKKQKLGLMLYEPCPEIFRGWNIPYGNGVSGEDTAAILLNKQGERHFNGVVLKLGSLATIDDLWADEFVASVSRRGRLVNGGEAVVSYSPGNKADEEDIQRVMAGNFPATRAGRLLSIIHQTMPDECDPLRVTVQAPPAVFEKVDCDYKVGNKVVCTAIKTYLGLTEETACEADPAGHDLLEQ